MVKTKKKKVISKTLNPTDLHKKVKTVCIDCTESTIKTYINNIKRLSRLSGYENGVPTSSAWLKQKKLLKTFDKQSLAARRVLSVAAVKMSQGYGLDKPIEWTERLKKAADEYDTEREKRKKTDREKENWPKDGYNAIKRAANEYKTKVSKFFRMKKPTPFQLYDIQKYVILKLYSEHALRLDWADVFLGKQKSDSKNSLYKHPRKGWTLIMRKYKTSKFMGEQEIKISRPASLVLSMFVPKVKETTSHGYLLSNKGGSKMSRSNLSKVLIRLTQKLLKKRIGAQIVRVLKATKYRKSAETNAALSKEMLHNKEQHLLYAKKD